MTNRKKLIFCTYPSYYSSIVFDLLIRSPSIEVVAVISSTRNLKVRENKLLSDVARIKQSGIRYAFYLWFVTSGFTIISALTKEKTVERIAKNSCIPIYKTSDINDQTMAGIIESLRPDILLCAHFNQRIAPSVYALAAEMAVNIHPSLLPDMKGVDPAFYSLLEDYIETGVTLHALEEDFDEGLILAQLDYGILNSDSLFSLNKSLFHMGAKLFLSYFHSNLEQDAINTKADRQSRYDSWPSKSQVTNFMSKRRLISFDDIKGLFQHD